MAKRLITICITVFMLCAASGKAQDSYWSKVYDFYPDNGMHSSRNLAQYADDSILVGAGNARKPPGTNYEQVYIATFDYSGTLLSRQTLDFAGIFTRLEENSFAGSTSLLTRLRSGNYLLAGEEYDLHSSKRLPVYQPWLYIFDKHCDSVLFVKYTDTIVSRMPYSVIEDKERNIVVTGVISSEQLHLDTWDNTYWWDSASVWLAKYDSAGRELWSRKYFTNNNFGKPGSGIPVAFEVINSQDSGYIVTGGIYNAAKQYFDVFIMKTDTAGNMLWQQYLPRPYFSWNDMDIIPLKDGGYGFISTRSDTLPDRGGNPGGLTYTYYGKLDGQGDLLWERKFRGQENSHQGKCIAEAANRDLVLFSQVGYAGRYHNAIIRTDDIGRIKSYREYDYIDTGSLMYYQHLINMDLTGSGQIFMSGEFRSSVSAPGVFDSAGQFSWFVLTDTFGCIVPGCEKGDTIWNEVNVPLVNNSDIDISIYPNPVTDKLFVKTGDNTGEAELYLVDITGRRNYIDHINSNSLVYTDLSVMPAGLYLLEVWQDGVRAKVFKVQKR